MCHVDDVIDLAASYSRPQQMFLWPKARGGSSTVQGARRTEAVHPSTEAGRALSRANIFPQRWAESRRLFLVVLIMILSDIVLALAMWQPALVIHGTVGRGPLSAIAIASIVPNVVAWIGLRAVLGLYPGYGLDQVEELRRQTLALLATLTIIVVFAFAAQLGDSFSRVFLFAWALGLLLVAPIARYFVKWVTRRAGLWGKPVVVLGAQEVGVRVLKVLQKEWHLGFNPAGVFDNRRAPEGGVLEGVPYGGTLNDAVTMAREYGIDTAIFAIPHTRREDLAKLVNRASTSFRYVIVMPNLAGITNSAVIPRHFAGNVGLEIKYNLLFPWARRTKRILDLLLTMVGGLLISPLVIMTAILIKLDSPGPVFYGHRRLGAGGEHFRCWKFRTMYTNAEQLLDEFLQGKPDLRAEWEHNFKLRDDPRVTRVGRLLRHTSLDELPQLWNVLLGEMSLVGPRPIVDAEIPKYGAVYEMYRRIRPGISGLWQISGRSDMDYAERVELDAYYVHNWSVWLDLVILVRTVWIVMMRRGAY
jgi:Undecaprenyl-phosphate galactose phosphotransferase WbaP